MTQDERNSLIKCMDTDSLIKYVHAIIEGRDPSGEYNLRMIDPSHHALPYVVRCESNGDWFGIPLRSK